MLKARNVLRTLGEAARRETLSQRVGWRVGDDAAVNCRGNVPPPPTSILMHTVSTHFWQSTPLSGSVLNRACVGCNNMWCAVVGTPIAFVVFGGQNAHFNSSRYVFVFTFASNYWYASSFEDVCLGYTYAFTKFYHFARNVHSKLESIKVYVEIATAKFERTISFN